MKNKISTRELQDKIKLHRRWLSDKTAGARLTLVDYDLRGCDLRDRDLSYSDLRDCDLRDSNLSGSNLRYCDLSGSDLRYCDLSYCDLSDSDLRDSDLRYCDLRYSDLDFTQFSLSCKTRDIKVCNRLPYQLAWHICAMISDDKNVQKMQEMLKEYANVSHLIDTHAMPKF